MKKVLLAILVMGMAIMSLTGCEDKEKEKNTPTEKTDAVKFKEEYEALNGEETSYGGEYRSIEIPEYNPFVYATAEEIVEKIENEETFYVYFGSAYCPWCRSVIEMAIEMADYNNIDTIYYVDIWGEDHEEILRDVYKLNDKGKPELVSEGSETYQQLLEHFDSVLDDYTLTNDKGKEVKVGEKRIYAPNFIYVSEGSASNLATGMSELQKSSNDELTEEILEDERKMFDEFFINEDLCDSDEPC